MSMRKEHILSRSLIGHCDQIRLVVTCQQSIQAVIECQRYGFAHHGPRTGVDPQRVTDDISTVVLH
jgi:hypothetical protein